MKRSKVLWGLLAAGVAVVAIGAVITIILVMQNRPLDEKPLVIRTGVLEFRIAPTLPGSAIGTELTNPEYETYMIRLAEQYPLTTRDAGDKYLWFPVHDKCGTIASNLVVCEHCGRKYILLYNQPGYEMPSDSGNPPWSLMAKPTHDSIGRPAVGFSLDERGARLMGLLTGAHQGHFLAILVNDEVYSAPVIKSTIYDSGIISGDFTVQEVEKLVRTLEGRSLPSSNRAEQRKIPTSSPAPTN